MGAPRTPTSLPRYALLGADLTAETTDEHERRRRSGGGDFEGAGERRGRRRGSWQPCGWGEDAGTESRRRGVGGWTRDIRSKERGSHDCATGEVELHFAARDAADAGPPTVLIRYSFWKRLELV
jgi:hypothetical protein